VTVNGQVVVPAGSEVTGVVTEAEGSGRVKGRARIAMRFNGLRANGESYDIKTSGYAQEAAATKKQDAEKIAIGAGAGAALGAILGGGGGAAKGAAIGGAGGTGVVLATKGKEFTSGPEQTSRRADRSDHRSRPLVTFICDRAGRPERRGRLRR
jgi:hypothetical protein